MGAVMARFCRRQQEELERRMKAMDKEDLQFEEQVGSLKEQAEQYTKKLKKVYASYQTKKSEREGLRKEFQVGIAALWCHAVVD
jgi:chromosome segregation ATPase